MKCLYVKEQEDVMPWFNVVNTNNRYWGTKTIRHIVEGGFMTVWSELAFHVQQYSAHKLFHLVEIPDSIQRKELWSIVLICLGIISVSLIFVGLEIIYKFLKLGRKEKSVKIRRMKHRLKMCVMDSCERIVEELCLVEYYQNHQNLHKPRPAT